MRRLFVIIAAIAAVLGPASVAGYAAAREHGDRGEHGGRGGGHGGGPPPWSHGGGRGGPGPAPGWAPPDGGRWVRGPGRPEAYAPPAPRGYGVRRGGYLPPQARGGVVQDYRRYRLRPPPPGYGWVRSGRSVMLMDMGTGQVFDVIPD
jgi:Ni/Co efflux regulator RcnB